MSANGINWTHPVDILRYEEMLKIVSAAAKIGIKKVRITGGEPLARKGIVGFINSLKNIDELEDVGLTTNGVLLEEYAEDLYKAGISRLNISLDTLNPGKFKKITRGGDFFRVMRGIDKAADKGFSPIKINVVLQKGFNDVEVYNFVRLAIENPFQVRFIEYMPVYSFHDWKERYVSNAVIKKMIESVYGELRPLISENTSGPAESFMVANSGGVIGFISSVSDTFCGRCSRIRLSADGKLYQCLFAKSYVNLKVSIRKGCGETAIKRLLISAVKRKRGGHSLASEPEKVVLEAMSSIGG